MPLPTQTQGLRGNRDERGLIGLTVPWVVATLEEVLTVGATSVFGLPETKREWNDLEAGKFLVNISYEGAQSENGDKDTYEFDSSFSEEPIESHPDIETIKAVYGGTVGGDGKITFPEKMPSAKGGGGGLSGGQSVKQDKNPLFGLSTYLVTKAVFRHTYLRRVFPATLLDKIGSIVHSLPEGFPTPSSRNWLFMPPKVTKRGNMYEITEELMLSAKGGWPDGVYKLIQR